MTKRIALFSHKGGVSKTTTTFHLAWMLAQQNKKVLMVDADSQCNLTALVMGEDKFDEFYRTKNPQNIKDALLPAFKSKATLIQAVECFPLPFTHDRLFLLPGHLALSEYEVTLGFAQMSSEAIFTLQNIPGAFSYLFAKTAERYGIDYILIDMSPSLSSTNQNLLMTSDYFIVPTSPDYFSMMAIESMSLVFPKWAAWAEKFMKMDIFTQEALYPLPMVTPKFLGAVVQRFSQRSKEPTKQFQPFIDDINWCIQQKLWYELEKKNMCFKQERYHEILGPDNFFLAKIPDFASLNPLSQRNRKAIFALRDEDMTYSDEKTGKTINYTGTVLDGMRSKRDDIEKTFSTFAEYVCQLTAESV